MRLVTVGAVTCMAASRMPTDIVGGGFDQHHHEEAEYD